MAELEISQSSQARRLDLATLGLALVLFISPWMMNYVHLAVAAKTAWISAVVIALISIIATLHAAAWEDWANLFAGIWLLAAPTLLNFNRDVDAIGAFIGIGAFVAAISFASLSGYRRRAPS